MGLSIQEAIVSKGSRLVGLDLISSLGEDPGDLELSVDMSQLGYQRLKLHTSSCLPGLGVMMATMCTAVDAMAALSDCVSPSIESRELVAAAIC